MGGTEGLGGNEARRTRVGDGFHGTSASTLQSGWARVERPAELPYCIFGSQHMPRRFRGGASCGRGVAEPLPRGMVYVLSFKGMGRER